MNYREEQRDLFEVNAEVDTPYCLAHCISSDFAMSGGIVLGFNERWNMKGRLIEKYEDQQHDFHKNGVLVFPEEVLDHGHVTTVYNLVTKPTVFSRPTYLNLNKTLELMRNHMQEQGFTKLAIPLIGCGIDGLEWKTVSNLIKQVFQETNVEILVCYL